MGEFVFGPGAHPAWCPNGVHFDRSLLVYSSTPLETLFDSVERIVGPNPPSIWFCLAMVNIRPATIYQMSVRPGVFGPFWFPFDPKFADASAAEAKFIKVEIPKQTFVVLSSVLMKNTGLATTQWYIPDAVKTPGRLPFTWKASMT